MIRERRKKKREEEVTIQISSDISNKSNKLFFTDKKKRNFIRRFAGRVKL